MVDFGSCGSVADHSGALQMIRERDRLLSSLRDRLYQHVFPLLSREFTEEYGHVGKYKDRCGLWKDQDVSFVFSLYIYLYR